jgi:hypothetical protein
VTRGDIQGTDQTAMPLLRRTGDSEASQVQGPSTQNRAVPVFYRAAWISVNALLALSILLTIYFIFWEYSTRRYLEGFSDAIVPATAAPEEKIAGILNWMQHGPARRASVPDDFIPNRNPTDTLNYEALLRVCGTATNAFINLAEIGGMPTRRLLLLDSRDLTKHVVAEVLVDGRWIVVDATFRVILRGPDGQPLTREQLANPELFAEATKGIDKYDPNYTYDHTSHIRVERLGFFAPALREVLDHVVPGWENSPITSALVERESLAATFAGIILVLFLSLSRISLRWFGEKRLGVRRARVRTQIAKAYATFLELPNKRNL